MLPLAGCRWIVACAVLASLAGCATYADRSARVRYEFGAGHLTEATEAIEKASPRRGEKDCLELDRAMVLLAAGKPKEAEQTLRQVRDHFDHLEQTMVGEKALSMLTDANTEAYDGEDYEKILVRVFLSLSNLMSDAGDALAYSLQVGEKQQQLIQAGVDAEGNNPKTGYSRVAVGPYLHGALREASHTNYDDVERSCAVVCSWQPDFAYGPQDLERAKHGHHSSPGCGVLYVFTLVGVGPHKEETIEAPSTVALLIADRLISAFGSQTLPPTIAPIKVPKLVKTQHDVGSVAVAIDGRPVGYTATITDIGAMATQQYEAVYDRIVAEAVVRRVVKKSVIFGTKKAIGVEKNSLPGFALDVVGVAWEATESADTRCWSLLPDKIQVLRVEVPAGTHQLTLQSFGHAGFALGHQVSQPVTIADGRNTYVLGNFPNGNLVGNVLTNQP